MGRYVSAFQRTYAHGTFVIWPPDDVRERVNQLRQRYDPTSQAICEAHVTLTQPFLAEPDAAAWREVTTALATVEPFTITYGPLRSFLPYPCVYLEIAPREPFMRLRTALHNTGLFNLRLPFSDGSFVPHMSITDGYPDEQQTRSICAALSGSEPQGNFPCIEVAYIRPGDSFHFEVQRTLALGERRDGS